MVTNPGGGLNENKTPGTLIPGRRVCRTKTRNAFIRGPSEHQSSNKPTNRMRSKASVRKLTRDSRSECPMPFFHVPNDWRRFRVIAVSVVRVVPSAWSVGNHSGIARAGSRISFFFFAITQFTFFLRSFVILTFFYVFSSLEPSRRMARVFFLNSIKKQTSYKETHTHRSVLHVYDIRPNNINNR